MLRALELLARQSRTANTAITRPSPTLAPPGHHHTLVGFDIAGFGSKATFGMDSARTNMFELVQAAFAAAGLGWPDLDWIRDTGDGLIVFFPDEIPAESTIDPVVQQLHAGLRRYNKERDRAYQITLRMAVHGGMLRRDGYGLTGEPLVHLARLLDAQAFKTVLADRGTHLGLIVSAYIYDNVVLADRGVIDPASYFRLEVHTKETRADGWVYLPTGEQARRRRLADRIRR